MATVSKPKLLTAEEFMAADLGEGTFELVRGEVVEMPPPLPEHGRVCGRAFFVLETYGRQTGSGYALTNDSAVLTERGPDTVRGPDVCFYSHTRWPESQVGQSLPPVPPDLAVEVVSPRNRPGEMRKKIQEYLEVGVSLVWVIDPPRRRVAAYRPGDLFPVFSEEGDVLESIPELPGFRCLVADFFIPDARPRAPVSA
jgi:Uma2 family endonuclease